MRTSGVLLAILTALPTTGCTEVTVHTILNGAHHGTRAENGDLPDLGDPEKPRVFTNDLGWTINLSAGFIVSTAAVFERCDGETIAVDTPFGPFPEYWSDQDKDVTDWGFAELPEGEYCGLTLEYGRYRSDVVAMAESVPFPIDKLAELENQTVYLAGYAERPDGMGGSVTHNFGLGSDMTIQVHLPLDKLTKTGTPFEITGKEAATPELTVLKVYDALFQGVDFDNLDMEAFNKSLPDRLTANTRVIVGTSVY